MTRQHNKTPAIIRLRILASLVSWPRLGWSPGSLLPFMMTYALRSTRIVIRKRAGTRLSTPSPVPRRLKKAPARATLSPKGERAWTLALWASGIAVADGRCTEIPQHKCGNSSHEPRPSPKGERALALWASGIAVADDRCTEIPQHKCGNSSHEPRLFYAW
jgi:hypothetical protein